MTFAHYYLAAVALAMILILGHETQLIDEPKAAWLRWAYDFARVALGLFLLGGALWIAQNG